MAISLYSSNQELLNHVHIIFMSYWTFDSCILLFVSKDRQSLCALPQNSNHHEIPNSNSIFIFIQCSTSCIHKSFILTLESFKNNDSVNFTCLHQHRCAHSSSWYVLSCLKFKLQFLLSFFLHRPLKIFQKLKNIKI